MHQNQAPKLRIFEFGTAPEAAQQGYAIREGTVGTVGEIRQRFSGDLVAVKGAAIFGRPDANEWAIMAPVDPAAKEPDWVETDYDGLVASGVTDYCNQVCGGNSCGSDRFCLYGIDTETHMPPRKKISDMTEAEMIELGEGLLVHRIEAAGFSVSGPFDSRAAEDGEPTWVCSARAALAEVISLQSKGASRTIEM